MLHRSLSQEIIQYRDIDGVANVWIVKPSYNARGIGIYCTRSLQAIIGPQGKNGKNKQSQKVVQKYIEKPLCVNNKKFDFRQWVLVNSWEPLDVSIFSSAYLKLCGSKFDLKQLDDTFRHLSNFSLNKKGETNLNELTMSKSDFESFVRNYHKNETYTWEKDMLPKISDVVWRSLKALQETQEQRPNCYEIYGFDICLDDSWNPWVIEINLSPACAERSDFLT